MTIWRHFGVSTLALLPFAFRRHHEGFAFISCFHYWEIGFFCRRQLMALLFDSLTTYGRWSLGNSIPLFHLLHTVFIIAARLLHFPLSAALLRCAHSFHIAASSRTGLNRLPTRRFRHGCHYVRRSLARLLELASFHKLTVSSLALATILTTFNVLPVAVTSATSWTF